MPGHDAQRIDARRLRYCSRRCLAASRPVHAAGPEDFYKGKTISLVIGYSVGGGYDAYARLVARHLGKHIPGNPSVVPQNMTGAGSLKAANYIYSVAPKDGSAIGTFSRSLGIAPLLNKAEFDSTKFTWLGSVTDEVSLCVSRQDAAVKTWNDMLATETTFGGEGAGSDPNIFALLYRNVFGAKIKIVAGYPGTNEITLATERKEVDGLCGLSWSTLKGRYPHWLKDRKANILVQAGIKKEPELPNVPSASELATAAGSAPDPEPDSDRAGHGAAVRRPARHSRRPQGRTDRRLRPHHDGCGIPRRGEAAQLRRQSGPGRQARCLAGRGLCHAQGRHRQSRQGHVGLTPKRWAD